MPVIDLDVRWEQRFQNFAKAFALLRQTIEVVDTDAYSDLEKEGIIQRFEYTFELGWKTFRDYLDYSGVEITEATPRKVIKECAAQGIFEAAGIDGKIYLEMLTERNLLSHTYDEDNFRLAFNKVVSTYYPELRHEYQYLMSRIEAVSD